MKNRTFPFFYKAVSVLLFTIFLTQVGLAQKDFNNKTQQDSISKKGTKPTNRLVQRISLSGKNDKTTLKGSTTNLLIYNIAKAGISPNDVYPGYYQNVGTTEQPNWQRVDVTVKNANKTKEQ